MRQQLEQFAKSNQLAQAEQRELTNQLQLARVEQRAAVEKAALMQQEVQAARTENARLAEGFKTLATNSSQLTQEIRENRALAPNTIFNDFVSNRVEAAKHRVSSAIKKETKRLENQMEQVAKDQAGQES